MTDDRPLYLRIVDDLRRKIARGELPPGARLPSRPEIMRDYGVSNTVALRVGQVLVAEGLAEARSGSGTYVRKHPQSRTLTRLFALRLDSPGSPFGAEMENQGRRAAWSYESRTAVAPEHIRERLQLGEAGQEEDVVRTDYVFTADDEPTELSASWEPLAITRGTPVVLPEDGPRVGVIDRMMSIGIVVDGCTEKVRARLGTSEECAALRVGPGSIMLAIARTYYSAGRPVETADIVLTAERHELLYGERVRERIANAE
ncbi:GntR family transcriptional regulator [Nonomuraea sp. NPDC046570]|uniref:GntR family transcriptional regulator n=1 Tax=Nonomuraea sp. NPDC046570 TaxID=3155255 RepID=UPI0034083FE7